MHSKSTLHRLVSAASIAAGALAVGALSGCQQPKINCMSAHGDFAAVYELKSGDPMSPCGSLPGDTLAMQTYAQEGGLNGTPNYSDAIVVIRPHAVNDLLNRAMSPAEAGGVGLAQDQWYEINASGGFSAGLPDDDDFCMVPDLEAAEISLPLLPEVEPTDDDPRTPDDESDPGLPELPATTIRYAWTDAKFLVSADAQGTQFEADLTYTRDGCTAEYHVLGLYPAIGCESDDDYTADDNGINPDFAVRCEANIGMCVIAEAPPAYE